MEYGHSRVSPGAATYGKGIKELGCKPASACRVPWAACTITNKVLEVSSELLRLDCLHTFRLRRSPSLPLTPTPSLPTTRTADPDCGSLAIALPSPLSTPSSADCSRCLSSLPPPPLPLRAAVTSGLTRVLPIHRLTRDIAVPRRRGRPLRARNTLSACASPARTNSTF